uniref:Uncharacterized protein n=1 Tax=Aegilops tauschii subsp. strangulata TaxID=200361 RepID=A0A453ILZ4_AEGTS
MVIERIRARQRSRVRCLRAGDAKTRFFHLKCNSRRRKNIVARLARRNIMKTEQAHKASLAKSFFVDVLGTTAPATTGLNWERPNLPVHDLSELEQEFTASEIRQAIQDTPLDRASGPDGFTGRFFKAAADIILPNLLLAFHQLRAMNRHGLAGINNANIVVIPKTDGAASMGDFRPINLLNSVPELYTKVLATRLARRIHELISPTQSAFIRGRSIQDNFLFVQGMAIHFHRTKKPALFLKLDLARPSKLCPGPICWIS